MIVDNGSRETLVIDGVFEGIAGLADGFVSFIPNRHAISPVQAREGVLAGVPVRLTIAKDRSGPFWTARYEPID